MIGFPGSIRLTFTLTTCFIIRTLPAGGLSGWLTARDRTMHLICCFLLLLLSCFAALLISYVYRPSSRFLRILLGFVVNAALYRPGYLPRQFALNGSQALKLTTVTPLWASALTKASRSTGVRLPGFPSVTPAINGYNVAPSAPA